MARQVSKVLQVTCPKVVPEMVPEVTPDITPEVVPETLALNLFDIDPQAEPEKPLRIDFNLDQLEDSQE